MLKLFLIEQEKPQDTPGHPVLPAKRTEIPMPPQGGAVTVGSSRTSTVRPSIYTDRVSHVHCTIFRRSDSWHVVYDGIHDGGLNSGFRKASTNGIYNGRGERVESVDLRQSGDRVWLVFPPGRDLPEIAIVAEETNDFERDTVSFDPEDFTRNSLESIQKQLEQTQWLLAEMRHDITQQSTEIDYLKAGQTAMVKRIDRVEIDLKPLIEMGQSIKALVKRSEATDQRQDRMLGLIMLGMRVGFVGLGCVMIIQIANPEDRRDMSRRLFDTLPVLLLAIAGGAGTEIVGRKKD